MTWRAFPTLLRLTMTGHTDRVVHVISAAWRLAAERGQDSVTPEHLLFGLAKSSPPVLDRLGLNLGDYAEEIAELSGPSREVDLSRRLSLGPEVQTILSDARSVARNLRSGYVGSEHILLALLEHSEGLAAEFLRRSGADGKAIRDKLSG